MEFLELLKEIQEFIPPQYAGVSQAISAVFPFLLLAVSALTCFFGHKIHRIWSTFLFFCIGFLVGALSGLFFPRSIDIRVFIGVGLVLGLLAAFQSRRLLRLQLFILNSFMVYAALPTVLARWMPMGTAILIGFLAAVAVGLLAAKYKYLITICTTAVNGAVNTAGLFWGMFSLEGGLLVSATAVVLAAGGLAAQFYAEYREKQKERLEAEEQPAQAQSQ